MHCTSGMFILVMVGKNCNPDWLGSGVYLMSLLLLILEDPGQPMTRHVHVQSRCQVYANQDVKCMLQNSMFEHQVVRDPSSDLALQV